MPTALGQRLLFRQATHGGSILLLLALVALFLLIRFRPAIIRWWRNRR